MWDFDLLTDGAGTDSAQGWVPFSRRRANPPATMNLDDADRPEGCLDWGNRMNAAPVQGRTPGIVSAWHVDNGQYKVQSPLVATDGSVSMPWTALAGTKSAWCGLRAGNDFAVR